MVSSKTFDPLTDVPQNDEQVGLCLRYWRSDAVGDAMVELYQVRRAQGDGMLEAYEKALLAGLPKDWRSK